MDNIRITHNFITMLNNNKILKNLIFAGIVTSFLAGCSSYGVISENDVYMQKPTQVNLAEDENDITSFNAFKARQKGKYNDNYLIDEMHNRAYIGAMLYGGRPFPGTIGYNRPIGFHGMRYMHYQNNFFHQGTWGYNPWMTMGGFGYGYPYAGNMYGYPYSPYGVNNYNPIIHTNPQTPSGGYVANNSQNHFNRKRNDLGANSNRSSAYPSTLKSGSGNFVTSNAVNDETKGTSRRAVRNKRPTGNKSYTSPKNYSKSTTYGSYTGGITNASSKNSRTRTYAPSQSARRSGRIQTTRRTNVSRGSSHRTRSVNSSRSTRQASPSYRGSSNGNSVRSTSSSSRSSGASSRSTSSGSSSRSGRR